nr:putative transcription factor lepb [Quercus suber]
MEGFYTIRPQQMAVNPPRNLDPKDLISRDHTFSRPASEPTVMAFLIQRIKIAVICREVIDTMGPLSFVRESGQVSYDKICKLDAKFGALIANLPEFLRLDTANKSSAPRTGDILEGRFALPKAILNLLIHTRRCKLHLPFLIRSQSDARYTFSRETCLEAARMVMRIQQTLCEQVAEPLAQSPRLSGLLQHGFYAAIVLVMDTCVNNQKDPTQLDEVRDAMELIQQTKGKSRYADKFLDSLVAILRKHQIRIETSTSTDGQANANPMHRTNIARSGAAVYDSASDSSAIVEQNSIDDMAHEFLMQDLLVAGPALDLPSWDSLFNDLETYSV